MRISRNKWILALVAFSMLAATGCKKFLDVNQSPNAPTTATDDLILPASQAAIGLALGTSLNINGGFYAQYWTQSPSSSQYKPIDQYQTKPTDFDRVWGTLYSDALQDIEVLTKSKFPNYAAIAWLQKAYAFQLLTDAFGDVPLKEAFRGTGNLSPHFDPQQEVYDSIIAWTKRGIAMTTVSNGNYPASNDLVFGGGAAGMASWKQFGNTLLLRVYLRLSEVDPNKAKTGIQELYAMSPDFLTKDAKITYLSVGGNQNPLYAEGVALGRTQNLVGSATAVNAMKGNNDPRLKVVYAPNGAGQIVGIPQGSYATQSGSDPSTPAAITGGRFASSAIAAAAPVKLISAAESYFLQAEAVARGWATGNVATLFQAGIKASFDDLGLSATELATYLATAPDAQLPADLAGRVKAIITQKYYAMNGFQGFEAWTEWRRTGYPNFLVKSQASTLGTNDLPARLLYPDSEITRNANFPGVKVITEKVWWDKN